MEQRVASRQVETGSWPPDNAPESDVQNGLTPQNPLTATRRRVLGLANSALKAIDDVLPPLSEDKGLAAMPEVVDRPAPPVRLANSNPEVETAANKRVTAVLAGRVATGGAFDGNKDSYRTDTVSMLDMIREAMEGNAEKYRGALKNIKAFLGEVTFKVGNAFEAEGWLDGLGRVWQHGQSSDDILVNTVQDEGVNPISIAEIRDLTRFEGHVKRGSIKPGESYHVVSIVPNDERGQLVKRGYFLESMSLVVRSLKLHEDGKVTITSHFVAGVDMDRLSAELGDGLSEKEIIARQERALEIRHDHELVQEFFESREIELPNTEAETVLEYGFISTEDGTQIVKEMDEIAGRMLNKPRFYGTNQKGDYDTFLNECKKRAETFDRMAEDVLHSTYGLIRDGVITRKGQIPQALRELAKSFLIDRAINVKDIDPRIFGIAAAGKVEIAQQSNDAAYVRMLRDQAIMLAVLSDCPGGGGSKRDLLKSSVGSELKEAGEASTVNCPECSQAVPLSDVVQPDGTWKCPECGHKAGDPCTTEGPENSEEQ